MNLKHHNIVLTTFLIAVITLGSFSFCYALPDGESVEGGVDASLYSFDRSLPDTLTISTSLDNLIINFNSFSIAPTETVNFISASSFLNRVTGTEASSILGNLFAQGNIILINPNGINIGSTANINVASLIASTLDISSSDFLNGKIYNFFKAGESAFLINQGNIVVRNGGYACLLSQALKNAGLIQAELGTVILASGEETVLNLDDAGDISVVVNKGVQKEVFGPDNQKMTSAIENTNTGIISANGGKVILTANVLNKVFDYAINNSGIIEAKNLVDNNGVVELVATGAPIYNIGKIEAGAVKIEAPNTEVINKGQIIVDGTTELPNGGNVLIQANIILQQGSITANAQEEGTAGEITIVSTTSTVLDEGSSTEARALGIIGNGGRIIIDSTGGNTVVNKNAVIDVSAGAIAGNAGFIEISAFEQLGFYGVLNGRAPPGYNAATVLFDPVNIAISSTPQAGYDEVIDPATLVTFPGLIQYFADNDITVFDDLIAALASIEFNAGRDINIQADLVANGYITLTAVRDFNQLAGTVIAAAGNISISGVNLTLGEIYFGGSNFDATATGYIDVIGKIESAAVSVTSGTSTEDVVVVLLANDAYTKDKDGFRDTNYGGEHDNFLLISSGSGNEIDWIWLKFNLTSIPSDAIILGDAILSLSALTARNDITIDIYDGGNGWDELTITWNNQPSVGVTSLGSKTGITDGSNNFILSNDGKNALQADFGGYSSFVFKETSTTDYSNPLKFFSKDNNQGEPIPQLTFTYQVTRDVGNYAIGDRQDGTITLDATGDITFKDNGQLVTNGRVNVSSQAGAVVDTTAGIDIIANEAVLSAEDGIGSSDPLDTSVSYLQAGNTASGNIVIDNTGTPSLTLTDLDGLGYAVRNTAPGGIVSISAHSDLIVEDSIEANGDIILSADDNIIVTNTNVIAEVAGGSVYVYMYAYGGDINIDGSDVIADVNGYGHAQVSLYAYSQVIEDDDGGIVVGGNINITDKSLVHAECGGIILPPDGIYTALVMLTADEDINIDETSEVSALSLDDTPAFVLALAGGAIDAQGLVSAVAEDSLAGVGLLATGDIFAGNVLAQGSAELDIIELAEWFLSDYLEIPIDIGARYTYSSGILIGSLAGDITLGNVSADAVIVAALGLDEYTDGEFDVDGDQIPDGSIYDVGDVIANYLGMLARNNIGTAEAPIQTEVKILSAYSYDIGNIYINEASDIELGLYLPIFIYYVDGYDGYVDGYDYFDSQFGAIGASVAANNGIIHIVSVEDMIVNSVVAPQGGVYLESTEGSIYAGTGWCPAVWEQEIELPDSYLAEMLTELFLMDGWADFGGPDYFSAVTLSESLLNFIMDYELYGNPYLLPGPNVIAGSYSYFSAPTGTIGVGKVVSIDEEDGSYILTVDLAAYNPLEVCIQVVNPEQPAVPEGFIPEAGLTLFIGGSTAPDFEIDTGDDNGPLGVSGAIRGIVRPGVVAVTGVYPSPALDQTSLSPLSPPGYVFYDDTASECCPPLPGLYSDVPPTNEVPAEDYEPANQIWPPAPAATAALGLPDLLGLRYLFPPLEKLGGTGGVQVTPTDVITSDALARSTFFYHPLTETDTAAFDSVFTLGEGAYQFMEGNINIVGHDGLLPILEDVKKKKKPATL